MKIIKLSLIVCTVISASIATATVTPNLELIMSDTDWMGNAPENPYWGDDSRHIFFQKKQTGTTLRDWYVLDSETSASSKLDGVKSLNRDSSRGRYNSDRTQKVFIRDGDVFKKFLKTGEIQRITQTTAKESAPQFISGSKDIAFWIGKRLLKISTNGSLVDLIDIKMAQDEKESDSYKFLESQQQRYFMTLSEKKRDRTLLKNRKKLLAAELALIEPFNIDPDLKIEEKMLSPDGNFVILLVTKKSYKAGKSGKMPRYVADSGYVEVDKVRIRVGENDPVQNSLILLDIRNHTQSKIKMSNLPGIDKDPLKKLRKTAKKWHIKKGATAEEAEALVKAPKIRNVYVRDLKWSKDSKNLAVMFTSIDNKDRWIATIESESAVLKNQHRLTDKAWVNYRFNEFGWMPDNSTLWLLSEEDGFSHIYLKSINKRKTQKLTSGNWEVYQPVLSKDGNTIYFRANREHPGIYEIYKLEVATRKVSQITHLNGSNSFTLSEDETRLLIQHSTVTTKPEVYVKNLLTNESEKQLTQSMSEKYNSMSWVIPTIEKVPSSKVKQPLYSKLYQPKNLQLNKKYPAIIFVHGAGYTQNSHFGWAYYFHEMMFHTLLVNQGYIVLDMDYRGSAGYGRDWRTAIYRNMGHPEVEDLQDGVDFLVKNYQVDSDKVGVYGGSYGGFLTFMAMFREPDLFAAGAALRPVTDWASYNHGYTSNILNTPAVDPMAYEASSPMEFAEGLNKPLLIATGMMDNNVFFQDSVRLVQRLIELKKKNFELAVYPLERHGFTHHTSWLDEYRRIFKLFEQNLK